MKNRMPVIDPFYIFCILWMLIGLMLIALAWAGGESSCQASGTQTVKDAK